MICQRKNFGVWLVALWAVHFRAPCYLGVPLLKQFHFTHMKQINSTIAWWLSYACIAVINFVCKKSDFAGNLLSCPVFTRVTSNETIDFQPYTIPNYYNAEINFWCMISDFVGSLCSGSVFMRGPPMKQMIFTPTRWVVYTYTAEINLWCMIIDFSGIISVPKWHYKKFCIEI